MRYCITVIIILSCLSKTQAQKTSTHTEMLSTEKQAAIFTDSLLKHFNIQYPIYRAYQYSDKSGTYYCIITESNDEIINGKDTLNHQIKAVNLKALKDSFKKIWEINDHIMKDAREEDNIWFWTKYTELKDYDADGLIDPIIIYGTSAMNGYDDGRIKIIIYYNEEKIAIRHQNGVLDGERETQVDKAFYTLPISLQSAIKQKMELMEKNNNAIFPAGWQTAMKNKKTSINERY